METTEYNHKLFNVKNLELGLRDTTNYWIFLILTDSLHGIITMCGFAGIVRVFLPTKYSRIPITIIGGISSLGIVVLFGFGIIPI